MFKKLGAKLILTAIGSGLAWSTWATMMIKDNEAKADRVISLESKVDYIYKYIIENPKK